MKEGRMRDGKEKVTQRDEEKKGVRGREGGRMEDGIKEKG